MRSTTGLVLDPYFSATKAEWLLTDGGVPVTPDLAIGTIDAWILWNLTGGPDGGALATEPSNASRTMLFDIRSLAWSEELLDRFGVPAAALPEVRPSSGRFGVTARHRVWRAGIPVSGMAGDQQAALFGQACLEPGMTKNTYGTGSFVLMHVGDSAPSRWTGCSRRSAGPSPTAPAPTPSRAPSSSPAPPCSGCGTGSASSSDAGEIAALAAGVPDSEGCFLVPAFTGLGSPWWDPYARGTIVGITRGTGARPPGPGGARVDQPPDPRRGHRHERRLRPSDPCPEGRRRGRRQRPPPPAAGRRPPGAGVPPRDPGDHRPRRRLPGRPGRGRVGLLRRHHHQLALDATFEPASPTRRPCASRGLEPAVERSRGWVLA